MPIETNPAGKPGDLKLLLCEFVFLFAKAKRRLIVARQG